MKTIFLAFLAISASSAQITSFSHIVLIVQENRTPDNLFQGLCGPPYGTPNSCSTQGSVGKYDIQATKWLDMTSSTGFTNPAAVALAAKWGYGHSHASFIAMCDVDPPPGACKNDGAAASPLLSLRQVSSKESSVQIRGQFDGHGESVSRFWRRNTAGPTTCFRRIRGPAFPRTSSCLEELQRPARPTMQRASSRQRT